MNRTSSVRYISGIFFLLFVACSNDVSDPGTGKISILIENLWNGQSLTNEGTFVHQGEEFSASTLEYILTELYLETPVEGSEKSIDQSSSDSEVRKAYALIGAEHYVNFIDESTFVVLNDSAPANMYERLRVRLGVRPTDVDQVPNSEAFRNMAWPEVLGGGYHELKFEGRLGAADSSQMSEEDMDMSTDGAHQSMGNSETFLVHLGPSRGLDFSVSFELPISVTLEKDGVLELNLKFDLAKMFSGENVVPFSGIPNAVMGDQAAQKMFRQNLQDAITVE